MFKPSIIMKETDPPINNWCDSGHVSNGIFKEKTIRFFTLSGENIKTGIYCEVCLTIVNWMSKYKKGKIK